MIPNLTQKTLGKGLNKAWPSSLAETILLYEGGSVTIRPICPEDTSLLEAFLSRLSPETIYFRFLSKWNELIHENVIRLSTAEDRARMVLVAVIDQHGIEDVIAIASYDVIPQLPEVAEAAFIVENGYQGKGLGIHLIERLVALAYGQGLRIFQYFVHPNNIPMLRLLRHSGAVIKQKREYGICEIWVRLEPKAKHQKWMGQGVQNEHETVVNSAC